MQRNMDLIRQLLLDLESETSTQYSFHTNGIDELEKWYNVDLLVQAELIRGVNVRWAADGTGPFIATGGLVSLTWEGHEFLDAIRNDTVWRKAKDQVLDDGLEMGSLPFDVIKAVCVSGIRGVLGL